MTAQSEPKRFFVNVRDLPPQFPTHRHRGEFWQALGRVVATFGFLEETLGKAIFSFTATRPMPGNDPQAEFEKWVPTLERALTDPLGGLIDSYAKSVRGNSSATLTNLDDLLEELRKASAVRNALCHGSWRIPDSQGRSVPFFFNRKLEIFQDPIDTGYLERVREHSVELICAIMNSVTHMGWQFPGSDGPGIPIFQRPRQGEA